MEKIQYAGLEGLPKRYWKSIYTDEEKKARSDANKKYQKKRIEGTQPTRRRSPKCASIKIARLQASAGRFSAERACPKCLTKDDFEQIEEIYFLAGKLSESGVRHSVDHIYPLNGARYGVSGLHVPANLAVMKLDENMSKGNRPHKSWGDYFAFSDVAPVGSSG